MSYRSIDDSPFFTFCDLVYDDLEDGELNIVGVSAISNTPGLEVDVHGPSSITDSVDGDDGSIDGDGTGGYDLRSVGNTPSEDLGYTISFDDTLIGSFPRRVGLVFTDGGFSVQTQIEFFNPSGASLGVLGPFDLGDNSFLGTTEEDRFLGASNPDGIMSMTVYAPGGVNNLTVDHIQYVK